MMKLFGRAVNQNVGFAGDQPRFDRTFETSHRLEIPEQIIENYFKMNDEVSWSRCSFKCWLCFLSNQIFDHTFETSCKLKTP